MEVAAVIFIIFCAYLLTPVDIKIKSADLLKNAIKDINDVTSDVAHKVVPDCVFGVESVSIFLYTRNFPYGKNISTDEVCNDLDRLKPIVFLVHGFYSFANFTTYYKLSKVLIEKNHTVFSLDWSDAACMTGLPVVRFLGFPMAEHNTREIGELLASYVKSLINKCDVPLDNMTFIGHSLGAHVCGFASKEIQKSGYGVVPLLFALDPSRLIFPLEPKDGLCKTDARTAIVFHTSTFGIQKPVGHIDLYFNGGLIQPGCSISIACAHRSGIYYLAKMIEHSCGFPGVSMSKPLYPQNDTTDCVFMDSTIFDKNGRFGKFKGKTFYVFVKPTTFCTQENFNCQN